LYRKKPVRCFKICYEGKTILSWNWGYGDFVKLSLALTVGAAEPFRMVSVVEPAGMEAKAVTPNGRYSQHKRLLQKI
jgi:hypothetical protein